MTFGRVAEALPRAIRLVGWPKLVTFFFFFFLAVFSNLRLEVPIFEKALIAFSNEST